VRLGYRLVDKDAVPCRPQRPAGHRDLVAGPGLVELAAVGQPPVAVEQEEATATPRAAYSANREPSSFSMCRT